MNLPLQAIPKLEDGERLSRAEFERRYHAMPEVYKAELIEGVVHMASPVRQKGHGFAHSDFGTILGVYRVYTPGVACGDNSTVRLDLDNEPQPDSLLYIEPEYGGQATIDADGYIAGAPELTAEVSSSSVDTDLGSKKIAYQRNGVREYIVWRVDDKALDWFVLRGGQYELLAAGTDGVQRSECFPGLWIDAAALLRGDLRRVHEVLQQGLASPQHQAFVEQLRRQGPRPGQ
jgi:Uma2 family endonuclease